MDFQTDVRIAHKSVLVALFYLGIGLFLLSGSNQRSDLRMELQTLAVLFYVVLAAIWRLDKWYSELCRWFTILMLIMVTYLIAAWMDAPGLFAMLAIPTMMAGILINQPATLAIAIGETGLILVSNQYHQPLDPVVVVLVLSTIWAVAALIFVAYIPMYQVVNWWRQYYEESYAALKDAQDRKVELAQTLEDLERTNLQLTRINRLAIGLRRAAEAAQTAKIEFVANVSHELRTPLNMIIGFTEMIFDMPEAYGKPLPAPLMADLSVIHRNAEHLSSLIDDVLDLSQIDANKMALTKHFVQFQDIVETAIIAVRPLFDSKGLYLRFDVPSDLPAVFCDQTRIREVLLNLLSNAGRHTDQGGAVVTVGRQGNNLKVTVADSGSGIVHDDIGNLFKPFHQLNRLPSKRTGGTGLGLSISKHFVELHGGEIWAETANELGATFCFQIPIAPATSMDDESWRQLLPDWEYLGRHRPSKAPKPNVFPRFVILEPGDELKRIFTRYWDEAELISVTTFNAAIDELIRIPSQALLINDPKYSEKIGDSTFLNKLPENTLTISCSVSGPKQSANQLGITERLLKPIRRETLLGALNRLGIQNGTILIVDDEPDALQLFGRILLTSGRQFRVLIARDGQEAMDILQDVQPDVILLDLLMPTMDGFRLLHQYRQQETVASIPIIVISAQDPYNQPIASEFLRVGQSGGIPVPLLLKCIREMSTILSPDSSADPTLR